MNRIKSIRTYFGMSQTAFAEQFGVDQTAVSNWEKGKNSIDVKIVEKISQHFSIPMDYIYGAAFEITRPKANWHRSELEDYATAPAEIKDFLLFKYGRGVFHAQNDEKPADEGELSEEIVIYHRDGKTVRRKFSKEQLKMISAMLDAIPDDPDDNAGL